MSENYRSLVGGSIPACTNMGNRGRNDSQGYVALQG